jgi:hypothetical protein
MDWHAIEDRTRKLETLAHWENPQSIMNAVIEQYRLDKWAAQTYRPEVWVEKEALVGVVASICEKYDVPYFACRGYNSQSAQWQAGVRFKEYAEGGQDPIIFHLGDHDPSGIDMTEDNRKRLSLFAGHEVELIRLALNYDQVQQYNPPPDPAKMSDSRFKGYVEQFGDECWELDALDPQVIVALIEDAILGILDTSQWEAVQDEEEKHKILLMDARDSM